MEFPITAGSLYYSGSELAMQHMHVICNYIDIFPEKHHFVYRLLYCFRLHTCFFRYIPYSR